MGRTHYSADAVVIGGGIVGAACAYYLCAEGLQVHLVEREFPGCGTSRACDGLILQWDKEPGPLLELGAKSAALWAELAAELGPEIGYRRSGCLLVAENEAALEDARARAERLAAAGVPGQVLDGADLRRLEPHLAPALAGGVFFPDEAQVDPSRATVALLRAAQQRGLMLHPNSPVIGLERRPDGAVRAVRTPEARFATEHAVIAAGVWSAEVAALAGLTLPVQPRKGHVLVTEKIPGLIHHPLLEAGYVATLSHEAQNLQVALVAEETTHGNLLLGSSREFVGFDRTCNRWVLQAIAARAQRFLPRLARRKVIRSYAGLRPFSPDGRPFLGPFPDAPGLYAATGHEGGGICLAPITGRLIAQWVTGQPLSLGPEPFSPARSVGE